MRPVVIEFDRRLNRQTAYVELTDQGMRVVRRNGHEAHFDWTDVRYYQRTRWNWQFELRDGQIVWIPYALFHTKAQSELFWYTTRWHLIAARTPAPYPNTPMRIIGTWLGVGCFVASFVLLLISLPFEVSWTATKTGGWLYIVGTAFILLFAIDREQNFRLVRRAAILLGFGVAVMVAVVFLHVRALDITPDSQSQPQPGPETEQMQIESNTEPAPPGDIFEDQPSPPAQTPPPQHPAEQLPAEGQR